MCGISGLFKTNISLDRIHPMVQSLNHRGPDAQEYWIDNELEIAFGHARLSIIDIHVGNQPMTDAYGRYTIVFNGEIYGFRDLKLRYNQYPYQNSSDTELIFAMLYEHGYDFVKHLPGMFAFVIYDREKKELFGARDRFGEKPFFYTTQFGGFAFASELKALKKISPEKLNLDLRSVSSYMERLYVPANRCIYQEFNKLDPASCFTFRNGCLEINRYWELSTTTEKLDFDEAVDQLNIKLIESVKNQLVGDGGDEILGGYSQWYHNVLNPSPNSGIIKSGFGFANAKQRLKNIFSDTKGDWKKMGKTSEVENEFLYRHELNNVLFGHDKIVAMGLPLSYGYRYDFISNRSLNDVILTDIHNYMVGDILVKTDTTSMANSLELRAPFLDVNLAEFAISLPTDYKYKGGENKLILRELIKKHYSYLERQQGKLGFGAPVEDWLKLKEFDEYRNYVKNDRSAPVYRLIDFSKMGDRLALNNYRTWAVINLNAWLEVQSLS
jgi:asparagine synthetase B (glutamine-hydrolysing)